MQKMQRIRAQVSRPVVVVEEVEVTVPVDTPATDLASVVETAVNSGEGQWRDGRFLEFGDDPWQVTTPMSVLDDHHDIALVQCPTTTVDTDGSAHTVIGCGALTPDVRDDDGLVDCAHCFICFDPTATTNQTATTGATR